VPFCSRFINTLKLIVVAVVVGVMVVVEVIVVAPSVDIVVITAAIKVTVAPAVSCTVKPVLIYLVSWWLNTGGLLKQDPIEEVCFYEVIDVKTHV